MRALILAAGDGGRLGDLTMDRPKPLVRLRGRPIIAYTLDSLAECGVMDVAVVVGYRAGQVRAEVPDLVRPGVRLSFIENTRFEEPASLSLAAAQSAFGDETFLLVMADHMVSARLLRRLLAAAASHPGSCLVAADASPHPQDYIDEATKLVISGNGRARSDPAQVTAIGKGLAGWSALDAGAFVLSPDVWMAMDAAPTACELSVVFERLAAEGRLLAADVSGAFWYDIDTLADFAEAERLLSGAAVADIAAAGGCGGV